MRLQNTAINFALIGALSAACTSQKVTETPSVGHAAPQQELVSKTRECLAALNNIICARAGDGEICFTPNGLAAQELTPGRFRVGDIDELAYPALHSLFSECRERIFGIAQRSKTEWDLSQCALDKGGSFFYDHPKTALTRVEIRSEKKCKGPLVVISTSTTTITECDGKVQDIIIPSGLSNLAGVYEYAISGDLARDSFKACINTPK